jgi:hypothetical protein
VPGSLVGETFDVGTRLVVGWCARCTLLILLFPDVTVTVTMPTPAIAAARIVASADLSGLIVGDQVGAPLALLPATPTR